MEPDVLWQIRKVLYLTRWIVIVSVVVVSELAFTTARVQRTQVVVSDVAGKGVPAALLATSARYAVRYYLSEDMQAMMRAVNRHMLSVTGEDSFVTLLYGVVDKVKAEFRYVNAGHMPPIVGDGETGEVRWLEHSDPPLGVSPGTEFTGKAVSLSPGDTLVLYTDGVTDALESSGDSLSAFAEVLKRLGSKGMPLWREELLATLGEPRRIDDVTVVAIRVRRPASG